MLVCDYVCTFDDFVNLSKKLSSEKYRGYKRFTERNRYVVREITKENLEDARALMDEWCEGRNCASCRYGCEKKWVHRLLDTWSELPAKGLIVDIDDRPQGFCIAEACGDTLLKCEGKRYAHMRNHIAAFERCGAHEFRSFSPDRVEDFMCVVSKCVSLHSDEDASVEIEVAQSMLSLGAQVQATGLIAYAKALPIGAILGSMPRRDLLDIHLRYGSREYPGIYDALTHAFLSDVCAQYPIRHVNFEDDRGIEGLRTTKMRIPFDQLVPKYLCTRRL